MNTDIVDDARILINPGFIQRKNINITAYAKDCSIKLPKTLQADKILMHSDKQGYLSPDDEGIDSSLMGTMIDYLTRLVVFHKLDAFDFLGRSDLNDECKELFRNATITKLTKTQIKTVYQLCQREHEYRSGHYIEVDPDFKISGTLINHIKTMLRRSRNFFNKFGKAAIIDYHSAITKSKDPNEALASLYQKPIDSLHVLVKGDGDYLLPNALVDFKVSKSDKDSVFWKRQLIIYYLGLNRDELKQNNVSYSNLQYLINFNPRYDTIYKTDINPTNVKLWTDIKAAVNADLDNLDLDLQNYTRKLSHDLKERGLVTANQSARFKDPFLKYTDGIHKIERNEYERFWIIKKFKQAGQLYLIKRNGIYMFFLQGTTKSGKTTLRILNRGQRKRAKYDLQYYYDNLPAFVATVRRAFTKYQTYLIKLAHEALLIEGSSKSRYDGWLSDVNTPNHGSIVDVGFDLGHIYVDPLDGSLKYYVANNVVGRTVYNSLSSMLNDLSNQPYDDYKQSSSKALLKQYDQLSSNSLLKQLNNADLRLTMPKQAKSLLLSVDQTAGTSTKFYEDGFAQIMYKRSRAMTKVQKLLEDNIVVFWNDAVINHDAKLGMQHNKLPNSNRKQITEN